MGQKPWFLEHPICRHTWQNYGRDPIQEPKVAAEKAPQFQGAQEFSKSRGDKLGIQTKA